MRRPCPPLVTRLLPALLLAASLPVLTWPQAQAQTAAKPIPVILDTDIGDDIDDTWALALLLKCPEADVKLVVGDYGKNLYRARLLARLLETARRTDIPVGIGLDHPTTGVGGQAKWVNDYDLNHYPGRVYPDGVRALIDTILQSPEPVTLIAIGPLPNIAAALEREPRIAQKARFVGMHGSVRRGYGGASKPDAEWNVRADAKSCRTALSAAWDITLTPLDTCGLVDLEGEDYRRVAESTDPLCRALMENYRLWNVAQSGKPPEGRSSTLFDTVAVYLALSTDLAKMEDVNLRVTDDGHTVIDPGAKRMRAALEWTDLQAYKSWMVRRLTTPPPR